jgi:hypothetical protein
MTCDFGTTFQHFSIPLGQEAETIVQIEHRLINHLGLVEEINKRIDVAKEKVQAKLTTHAKAIKELTNFFTNLLGHVQPEVMVLMQNYQFAAAWHKYLTYQLIDLDATHVIVKLAINLLNLQFDKNIDVTYINFHEIFVLVHSLYLFKRWYEHFAFKEIKVIIMSTDSDFITKHAIKAASHNLFLPHLVKEQHKYWRFRCEEEVSTV